MDQESKCGQARKRLRLTAAKKAIAAAAKKQLEEKRSAAEVKEARAEKAENKGVAAVEHATANKKAEAAYM